MQEHAWLRDGAWLSLRPVRAADAEPLRRLIMELPPRERRWRFHGGVNGLSAGHLQALVEPGPALLAWVASAEGRLVAEVRCAIDRAGAAAELAVMVTPAWRRRGVARWCVAAISERCRQRGLRWIHGSVLADNAPMLALARRAGCYCAPSRDDAAVVTVERRLASVRSWR